MEDGDAEEVEDAVKAQGAVTNVEPQRRPSSTLTVPGARAPSIGSEVKSLLS